MASMSRSALSLLRCAVIALLIIVHGTGNAADDPRDFSGVWWRGPSPEPYALEHVGDSPVLNDAGGAAYNETAERKRAVDAAENDPFDVGNCVPVGVPRIWAQPYPFQIAVRPDVVAITYEHLNGWRVAYLDESPPTAETALSLFHYGNSGARWEGDTLVIESTAFHEGTFLDETGLPLTENLRTEERIRKLDDDTLEVVTTVEDPSYYVEPWTVRATFDRHPAARIEEFVCGYGEFETRYRSTGGGELPLSPAGAGADERQAGAVEARPDFSGVWRAQRGGGGVDEDGVILTAAGERIPFQPWARETFYDTLTTVQTGGTGFIDNRVRCLPEGAVDMWSSVWAFRIVQQPDIVYLLIDYDNQVRRVLMDAEFPADLKPTWNGTSIGSWDGDTLIVETRGFNDKTALMTLAAGGRSGRTNLPHSTELRVIERFSLSADGQTLTNEITIDDPEAFTKPWSAVQSFTAGGDWRPQEETCADSSLEGTFSPEELGGRR